ncbi:MAG: hypothetical protein DRO23_11490 [Thermoprotei archaeon]|nr:MAG: hypothetical protein DRO23_11490 [Thermoprotei archaeon]
MNETKEKEKIRTKAILHALYEYGLKPADILLTVVRKNGDKGDYLVKIYTKHQPILIEVWLKEGKVVDSYIYDNF